MRHDFGKVVIERPRSGSSARNAKVRWFGRIVEDSDVDGGFEYEGPSRIPGSGHAEGFLKGKIHYKRFTDVLGPVRGYLHSSLGRPWSKIYSELSEALGSRTWPLRHILEQHVDVASKTYRGVDGHVWELGSRGPSKVVPSYRQEFYVQPETGILRLCPGEGSRRKRREPSFEELHLVKAEGNRWFAKVDGNWFLGEFVDDGPQGPGKRFSKLKSCSKKEIRELIAKRNAELKKRYPRARMLS